MLITYDIQLSRLYFINNIKVFDLIKQYNEHRDIIFKFKHFLTSLAQDFRERKCQLFNGKIQGDVSERILAIRPEGLNIAATLRSCIFPSCKILLSYLESALKLMYSDLGDDYKRSF